MSQEEKYIPSARDAVVGYFGRNASGKLRAQCVTCNDKYPLTDTSRIYGDLYVSDGPDLGPGTIDRMSADGNCDTCMSRFSHCPSSASESTTSSNLGGRDSRLRTWSRWGW